MDALASFLEGPRARGAFVLRSILDPPWSLRIQDEAPLTVVAVVRGRTWFVPDDGEPVVLGAGDVAIIRGPAPYTVADHPDTRPTVVIHPGGHCTTLDGESLADAMGLGVRTWGTSTSGDDVMLTGTYQTDGEVSRWLLDALADLTVLRSGTWTCPVIPLLAEEITRDEPGQEVVLDRLLDLLLVAALRASFARPGAGAPAWYRAQSDPVVGPALKLMHNDPGQRLDRGGAGRGCGRLARRAGPAVPRPGRRAADDLPHRMAHGPRRRPAARAGGQRRRRLAPGRLREPVHLQHRVQARLRPQPARAYRDRERSAARQAG